MREDDAPAISSQHELAYVKQGQVWIAPLAADAKQKPRWLLFDRGKDGDLHWSPDGKQLAFVSNRDDHAFIAVFTDDHTPIEYLSPSTGNGCQWASRCTGQRIVTELAGCRETPCWRGPWRARRGSSTSSA